MSSANSSEICELIKRRGGLIKLAPTVVPRFYRDFDRLGQKKLRTRVAPNVPERWIASSVEAINPPPLPKGGLSMLADLPGVSLRDAIRAAPLEMLGKDLFARHGAEFRVLVKLLDPGEPIPFHVHATDAQVKQLPKHFRGHRFGKDEAYYFLEAPKGPLPYTHVGLHSGVSKRELLDAVKRGRDYALELSPAIYQDYESGFFLPAGVPHSPGTALTLEIQQPSDVYTLLETRAAGKEMSPRQIHPGFKSLDEAMQLVDIKLSERVGQLEAYRLKPRVTESLSGGEIALIFSPQVCRKFAGMRIRVKHRMMLREDSPVGILVWKGQGQVNGTDVRGGHELFATERAMREGLEIECHGERTLELFAFRPVCGSDRAIK